MREFKHHKIKLFLEQKYYIKAKKIVAFKRGVQNSNYLIQTDNVRFVFRVYKRKMMKDLNYTIQILRKLGGSRFPSPRLVASTDNQWVIRYDNYPCVLYKYFPGKNTNQKTAKLMRQLGRFQANMHMLLKNEQATFKQPNWDPSDLLKIVARKKEWLKLTYPESVNTVQFIIGNLKKFNFPSNLIAGGTHQDIKPENIIVNRKGAIVGIVDFDNGYYGALLYDIVTTICWYCFTKDGFARNLFVSFIKSYQKQRKLTSLEKKYFYQAMQFRLLREAIIWYLYVSHKKVVARKRADYFLNLYLKFKLPEAKIRNLL